MALATFKNIGSGPVDVDDGRCVPVEHTIDIDDNGSRVAQLEADGVLLRLQPEDVAATDPRTHADLQTEAETLGLPKSGSKDDLRQRIADHHAAQADTDDEEGQS